MDHRSALASYLWKCRISGAMYSGLPHSVSARPCTGQDMAGQGSMKQGRASRQERRQGGHVQWAAA